MASSGSKTALNACIVGLGGMGRLYWRELSALPDVRVTSVVSGSFPPEEAEKEGVRVYRDIPSMLAAAPRPDVCCVCTPSYLHHAEIKALLIAGIPVIAEKPLCLASGQAEELFSLAEKRNVPLFTAQVVRFSYPARLLREWVQTGRFGRVLDASFARLSVKPFWGGNGWVFDRDKSGHVPYDLHIHDLDLIVSLFGEPRDARYLDCGSGTKPYAELCRFAYAYPGFSVFAEAAWFDEPIPFTVRWRVCFERALAVSSGEQVTLYQPGQAPSSFSPEATVCTDTGINVPASGMYGDELSHFIACIREKRASDIVINSEVVTVLRVLERMLPDECRPSDPS